MKKLLIPLCFGIFFVVACSRKGDSLTHDSARQAAERYFTMLLDGRYEEYVNGLVDTDTMPDDMRSQMVDLMAQFMKQQSLNRGLLSVTATSDTIQDSTAYVFLDVLYGDSVSEQVGMPLRFVGDRWRME